ncbi:hypothetical protein VPH35_129159 [Triticum aestivum]
MGSWASALQEASRRPEDVSQPASIPGRLWPNLRLLSSAAEDEKVRGGVALYSTYRPTFVSVVADGYRAPEVPSTPWACSCWSSSPDSPSRTQPAACPASAGGRQRREKGGREEGDGRP